MKVELAHDILAKKVYEKASSEDKMILKIEQLIARNYERYQERNILMSSEDMEYIAPFLSLVTITPEEKAFVKKSQNAIEQAQRNRRRLLLAIIAILAAFGIFASYQYYQARAAKNKAEEAREYAVKQKIEADDAKNKAELAKKDADIQRDSATKARQIAEMAKKDIEQQRDSILIVQREVERQRQQAIEAREEATRQKDEAIKAKDEAIMARKDADIQRDTAKKAQKMAEDARIEAVKQKDRATASELKTSKLLKIASAKSEANQAIRLIRGGKIITGVQKALDASDTIKRYAAHESSVEVYLALTESYIALCENHREDIFYKHSHSVRAIAVNEKNGYVATGDEGGTVLIWNPNNKKVIKSLHPSMNVKRRIRSLAFSADGQYLVGGTFNGRILMWEYEGTKTRRIPKILDEFSGTIHDMQFVKKKGYEHLYFFTINNLLYIGNMKNNEFVIKTFHAPISAFMLGAKGDFALMALGSKFLYFPIDYKFPISKILKIPTTIERRDFGTITALAVNLKINKIAMGNKKGTVWVLPFKAMIEKEIKHFSGETEHRSRITKLAFDKKGHHLVSTSLDRVAKIWNVNNMQEERLLLTGHNGWIWGAVYHQLEQAEKVLTVSEDKTVRTWFSNSRDIAKQVRNDVFPAYKERQKKK